MSVFERLFGSKYDKNLPYAYQAKKQVVEGYDDITHDWFSDSLCALCNHLRKLGEEPKSIVIYECFRGCDKELAKEAYACSDGKWLEKRNLCMAHCRFGTVKSSSNCGFLDRDLKTVSS